jgi:hypothetical protein
MMTPTDKKLEPRPRLQLVPAARTRSAADLRLLAIELRKCAESARRPDLRATLIRAAESVELQAVELEAHFQSQQDVQ